MLRQHSEDHICTYVSGNTLVLVSPSRETDSLALICLTNSEAMLCRSHENKDRLPFILNMLGSAYNTKLPLEMNQQISLSRKNNSGKEDKTKLVAKLLVRLGKELFLNQMQRQLPQGQIYPYIIEDAFIAVNQGTKIGVCTNAEAKLYRSQRKRDYLTHIFTIAQTTYQSTLLPTISQCICLPVESESWKTESANFWMMHRAGMRKENLREFSQIDNYFKLGFESPEIRSKYQMPQGKVILGDIESKEYRNLNNIKDAQKIDVTKDTKEEASSFLRTAKSTFKINPNLVLLKCALFLYFGGISAVNPFYTVLMRNIGLNIEEIGIISACLPFAALVGAPIAGMLSDKLGQYRYVLIGTLICAIISQTCTLFADARTPDTFESYNSSAILYNSNNKTQLRIIASNWNFTKPLSTVRFTIPNSNNSYGCVATEKPINFNVIEEKGLTLFGNADVNLTRCTSQTEVEIIALEFVDIQRDIEHRYIHLRGFWMFFIIRVIANAMTSSCFVLFDAIVLSMVKEHNGDYGKQRFFSMLGLGSISPLSGVLVDWFSSIKGSRDYSVIFYFSDVFLFIVILLVWKLDVKAEKTQGSFFKNLQKLITIPEIPVFLFFMVLLGSNWGLTDSYLFIFLTDELNAPVSLLGLSITVGCFCGLPFLSISNQIIKKVGIMPMFLLAYLAHAARFIGYSFLQDPWITLAIESLKFLSYHLLQCAACNFCSLKAPKGLLATLTSIFGVSHYHLGRSAGAYAGGLLISQFGVRESFRIFAYAAILIGTSYMLIEFFILRRVARSRALREKETEHKDHEAPFLPAQ